MLHSFVSFLAVAVPDAGTSSVLRLGTVAAVALFARFLPKK